MEAVDEGRPPTYKIGDVVNGHQLRADNQWHPVPPPQSMSRGAKIAIGAGSVAGIAALALITAVGAATPSAEGAAVTEGQYDRPIDSARDRQMENLSDEAQHFLANYDEFVTPEVCSAVATVNRYTVFSNINVSVLMQGGYGYSNEALNEAFTAAC